MVANAQRRVRGIRLARVRAAVLAVLRAEGRPPGVEVSVSIVDDRAIRALNRRWLGHDEATDVVSFPLGAPGDPDPLLGEVVVSAERARAEARARGLAFEEELLRYVVHGVLHLLGYDDRKPSAAARMRRRQEEILASLVTRSSGRRTAG